MAMFPFLGIGSTLLKILPDVTRPGFESESRRQWSGHSHAGSIPWRTLDFQLGRNTVGALAHALQAESQKLASGGKARSVVLHNQMQLTFLIAENDTQPGWIRMPYSIGDSLLADLVQGVRGPNRDWTRAAAIRNANVNRSAFNHSSCAAI